MLLVCPFALVTVLVPLLHVIMPEGLVSLYPFGVHVMVLVSCVPCCCQCCMDMWMLLPHALMVSLMMQQAVIKSDRTKIFFISKINTMTR